MSCFPNRGSDDVLTSSARSPRGCGFFSETAGQLRIEHVLWCAKEASAPTQITVIAQSHDAKHHAHIPKMCSVFSSQWDDLVPGVAQVSPASGMPAAEVGAEIFAQLSSQDYVVWGKGHVFLTCRTIPHRLMLATSPFPRGPSNLRVRGIGWRGGSIGKGLCSQAWWLGFKPQDLTGRKN